MMSDVFHFTNPIDVVAAKGKTIRNKAIPEDVAAPAIEIIAMPKEFATQAIVIITVPEELATRDIGISAIP